MSENAPWDSKFAIFPVFGIYEKNNREKKYCLFLEHYQMRKRFEESNGTTIGGYWTEYQLANGTICRSDIEVVTDM